MFDKNKSFGIDKVHHFLLSIGALEIVKPLTYIVNLSVSHGHFLMASRCFKLFLDLNKGLTYLAIIIGQFLYSLL